MACPVSADQIKNVRIVVDLCKKNPDILHMNELAFLKTFIESFGGVIPQKKVDDELKQEPTVDAEPENEEVESAESEVELDYSGILEPDNDPPQIMGSSEKIVSEDDMEKSNEKKREAMEFYNCEKYEDAVNAYTEAILLNPASALLYAKRGQCYLQLKKPNACIRDCTQALEINPDNAAAYKFRGRAHRLLGNFLKAAEDLRMACKIDFDEQADEWLKEVTPNARKLVEHQRKYERKKMEKELNETKERIRKMKEEHKRKAAEAKQDSEGTDGFGGMGDFLNIMKDPEILAAFQDPEIAAAFREITQNPAKIVEYQNNPKVCALLQKFMSKYSGQMPGVFPGGFPRFGGQTSGPSSSNPPKTASDVDLD